MYHRRPATSPASTACSVALTLVIAVVGAANGDDLPVLNLPVPKIAEVYRANWLNTLNPCTTHPDPGQPDSPHAEPRRPWKVDVNGHYPGWYPGVDVKHQAAAYLACGRDLPRVLQAWNLTTQHYMMPDGGIKPSTMHDNPHGVWPEATGNNTHVYYPLRLVATIDYLILGDMIFRYSQDADWLAANLPAMRRARNFLSGWINEDGLLHGHSYDLDQVYREIDGVGQAGAFLAFTRLAALERRLDNTPDAVHAERLANRLGDGANRIFWNRQRGWYDEHLIPNNVAHPDRLGSVLAVSSQRSDDASAAQAIDGVIGIGVDAFGVGIGTAGSHEWCADRETRGAWIRIGLSKPTRISQAVLVNRTAFDVQPGERFATGVLTFSDGSPDISVAFNPLTISRATVSFEPRTVTWVQFTGTEIQGTGGTSAGLAEFQLLPTDEPYRRVSHGMTDTNFAMLAFGVADDDRARSVWEYFRKHKTAFYEHNGLSAPTWISQDAASYSPAELNKRAPFKDCVAIARIWRYDALMRRRMNDPQGLLRTIEFANALFDRPSGGGTGFFAERYGLAKFQPGDEAQATIPKYAGYPAIYNAVVVQEAMLGLTADVNGTIHIAPCVPPDWYDVGFGQSGCGVLHRHDVSFHYERNAVEGVVRGPPGERRLSVQLPPGVAAEHCIVTVSDRRTNATIAGDRAEFAVLLDAGTAAFRVDAATQQAD